MEKLTKLITLAVGEGFSDIHITGGHPSVFRRNGEISFDKSSRWTPREIDDLLRALLTPRQLQMLKARWSVDLAVSVQHVRIRMNAYHTTRGLSMAIRLLPGTVPSVTSLNLHPSLEEMSTSNHSGLILICGATGSGKSTTIAAMVDAVNASRAAHIVTLEDPIEFRFQSKQSFIEQRELGTHIPSFEQGLVDVLRQAPDVIVVGELREPETIRLTINAAESGHLVIASLHASNTEDALHRICNSFPPETQEVVRNQLASTLLWVIIQQLTHVPRLGFQVPVLSILRCTPGVKGIIRDNRLSQIENAIQTGRGEGMYTSDAYWREFLGKKQLFTQPSENFKPSQEVTTEVQYQSPLIDHNAVPVRPSGHNRRKTDVSSQISYFSPDQQNDEATDYYVINEEARVDELINEIARSERLRKGRLTDES